MYELDLRALPVGHPSGDAFLGREFPAGLRGGREVRARNRAAWPADLCGQTLGGIVGALMVSLVLIPWIGSQETERVMLIVAVLSGLHCCR